MIITLYNSSAEKTLVDKSSSIKEIVRLNGILRNECDIIKPSILINLNIAQLNNTNKSIATIVDKNNSIVVDDNSHRIIYNTEFILTANYAYIAEFNRYYFINDIVSVRESIWRIELICDVLMSYKNEIDNLYCWVSRSENTYDDTIEDTLAFYEYDKQVEYTIPTNIDSVTTFNSNIGLSNNFLLTYMSNETTYWSSALPSDGTLNGVSVSGAGAFLATQYRALDWSNAYSLINTLFINDIVKKYIKSIVAYPFEIGEITTTSKNIIIGDINGTTSGSSQTKWSLTLPNIIYAPRNIITRIVIADFIYNGINMFLDYEPYSQYELYIPYYGYVKISANELIGKRIKVFYTINYENGSCSVTIYNYTDSKPIFSGACQIGVKIGLSSTNTLEIENQKTSVMLNSVVSGISSALMVVGGIASSNPMAVIGGTLGMTKSATSAISKFNNMYVTSNVQLSDAPSGLVLNQQVFIKHTHVVKLSESGYNKLYGKPLNKYVQLKDLHGFVICDKFHLENFSTATLDEINSLTSLLKTGIILT